MTTARRVRLPLVVEDDGSARVQHDFHPSYVVWELTLRCDQPCTHCGSRAGQPRPTELTTAEALGVVAELASLRAKEVVLIGGEAYLHPGYLEIIAALARAGIDPVTTTGGRGIDRARARSMAEAGLRRASVSIDGLAPTHDAMRRARGSFASATAALGHFRDAGVVVSANTNVNRFNEADLELLYDHLRDCGIVAWQVQLTSPLGRAADRPEMLLQPWELLTVIPRIASLKTRAAADGILVMPGNNLGYFGPEEGKLRSPTEDHVEHWQGCQAGRYVLGIESDGGVKGCPSLQASYVGGTLRAPDGDARRSLDDIWRNSPELQFARGADDRSSELWGFCATCDFAEVCGAGCTFTAHAFFGRPGNNPYCHFRARVLKGRGLRERLVRVATAPGLPFDCAPFVIVEEPFDAVDDRAPPGLALLRPRRRRLGETA